MHERLGWAMNEWQPKLMFDDRIQEMGNMERVRENEWMNARASKWNHLHTPTHT